MTFDWQIVLVLAVVATAAAYLAYRAYRTWRGTRAGCGGGCGCGTKTASPAQQNGVTVIPTEQLTLRRRSGGS